MNHGVVHRGVFGPIRSYDHTHEVFSWEAPRWLRFQRAAIDVEAKAHPSAQEMASRFGLPPDVFLRRWTASEAQAKALDVPILSFVREEGLAAEATRRWTRNPLGLLVCELVYPTHWVTVAVQV